MKVVHYNDEQNKNYKLFIGNPKANGKVHWVFVKETRVMLIYGLVYNMAI